MPPPPGSPFDQPQDRPPARPDLPGPYEPRPGYDDPFGRPGDLQDESAEPRGGRLRGLPFPSYTTRTRGGTQVTVGGCCLPIPIGCLGVLTLAAAVAREVRRSRTR